MRRGLTGGHGVLEWLGAGERAPWLHFAHATGMCAEVYADLLAPLAGEFNIVASDARGHGRSTLAADPAALTSWRTYEDDLVALLAHYPARRWLLAGHSMGASVGLDLAPRRPDLAAAVLLVEPACVPFAQAGAFDAARAAGSMANPMGAQAAKRRAIFASRDEARGSWHGRGVFRGWPDAALDAYVVGGMRDRTDGQVELACAPAWEAATFAAVTTRTEASVRAWGGPLALLYGTTFSTVAPDDAAAVAALHPGASVERIARASHFLPLEHPDRVRAAIRALAVPERG